MNLTGLHSLKQATKERFRGRSMKSFLRLPSNPTTITGRMIGIATVSALLAVVDSSLIPLLSQLLWVLIVAFLCGLLFRPKLQFHIKDPSLLVNGQASTITIVVENIGSYPAYDVQLTFLHSDYGLQFEKQPRVIGEIASQGQVVVSFRVQAVARGEHPVPTILVASLFPFGMFRFISKQRIDAQIVVVPGYCLVEVEESLSHSGDSCLTGLNSRRQRALEYVGSREYRDGLPVRRWDFAAWARLGIPAIREFNEPQEPTALIVVDTLKYRGKIDDELETLLSKTAGATVVLSRSGFRLVLVLVGKSIEIVDGEASPEQSDALLTCLARVKGTMSQPKWSDVWANVTEVIENDWDLVCFLRSDHPTNPPFPSDESQLLDATLDWTPAPRVGHSLGRYES